MGSNNHIVPGIVFILKTISEVRYLDKYKYVIYKYVNKHLKVTVTAKWVIE